MTVSDLLRGLIEGAEVKVRPALGATLYIDSALQEGVLHDR